MVFDPRVGLALLVFANLAAFSEQHFWMEMIWIGFLLFLMLLHRCFSYSTLLSPLLRSRTLMVVPSNK